MNVVLKPILMDLETTAAFVSLSPSSVERLVRAGSFPQSRELSDRRVAWLVPEVEEWAANRPKADMLPPPNTGHANRKRKSAP